MLSFVLGKLSLHHSNMTCVLEVGGNSCVKIPVTVDLWKFHSQLKEIVQMFIAINTCIISCYNK